MGLVESYSCGPHGQKLSMKEVYTLYTVDNTQPYDVWDKELSYCVCDPGYTGSKCEMSECHLLKLVVRV